MKYFVPNPQQHNFQANRYRSLFKPGQVHIKSPNFIYQGRKDAAQVATHIKETLLPANLRKKKKIKNGH